MADSVGIKAKLAFSPAVATWGTAFTKTGQVGMPYTEESLTKEWQRIESEALLGFGGKEASEQGNLVGAGSTTHQLDYNNFLPLLKGAMGAEAGGVVTIEDLCTEMFWIELDKQVSRWRYGAAMATKMTISGAAGEMVKGVFEWAFKLGEENATAFTATISGAMDKVLFSQLVFRIADQLDAIAGGDAVGISSFELEFNRNMKVDDWVSDASKPQEILVPLEGEFREATLKVTVPRYAAATFQTWKDADTNLQADLVFSGPSAQSLTIELPQLKIIEGFNVPVGGPGVLTQEGTLEVRRSLAGNPMYVGNEIRITQV
jgi:hypothetical protein